MAIDCDDGQRAELRKAALLAAISEQARILLGDTVPIVEILRTLRILAINSRLEAGRAGAAGTAFGFVAKEVSASGRRDQRAGRSYRHGDGEAAGPAEGRLTTRFSDSPCRRLGLGWCHPSRRV